jgi:hypothetical protein
MPVAERYAIVVLGSGTVVHGFSIASSHGCFCFAITSLTPESQPEPIDVSTNESGVTLMAHCQIAVIVGSPRRDSFNHKLTVAIEKLASPEFKFNRVQIGDLPLYSQDEEKTPDSSVQRLKAEIRAAQGLLFCDA